jgi:short-subunit dehydrogenase
LVTGATSGIGHAFARRLAASRQDLVLVARTTERLEAVAEELRRVHGVRVEVLPADLADPEDLRRVAARLTDAGRPVDLLVNNAGFGARGRLLSGDVAEEVRLLDVLVRAVLVLTCSALPGMVERGRGRVVNVSSVASFVPGGTYSAAKAWVTTFTQGLHAELAGTGVTATALCPGYVRTEFFERAGLNTSRLPEFLWLEPDEVVAACLRDVALGRVVSIPTRRYAAMVAIVRHVPLRVLQVALRLGGGRLPRAE